MLPFLQTQNCKEYEEISSWICRSLPPVQSQGLNKWCGRTCLLCGLQGQEAKSNPALVDKDQSEDGPGLTLARGGGGVNLSDTSLGQGQGEKRQAVPCHLNPANPHVPFYKRAQLSGTVLDAKWNNSCVPTQSKAPSKQPRTGRRKRRTDDAGVEHIDLRGRVEAKCHTASVNRYKRVIPCESNALDVHERTGVSCGAGATNC